MAPPLPLATFAAGRARGLSRPLLPLLTTLALAAAVPLAPVQAGPVLCTTTLEAPPPAAGQGYAAPVEVSRCGPVMTPTELTERRFYSYTSRFAPGVSLLHQFTDALGLALAGESGDRLVALGFPDQTVVWDATALENTTARLLEDQSPTMPLRTADLPSMFTTSLGYGSGLRAPAAPRLSPGWMTPVRGLW